MEFRPYLDSSILQRGSHLVHFFFKISVSMVRARGILDSKYLLQRLFFLQIQELKHSFVLPMHSSKKSLTWWTKRVPKKNRRPHVDTRSLRGIVDRSLPGSGLVLLSRYKI